MAKPNPMERKLYLKENEFEKSYQAPRLNG